MIVVDDGSDDDTAAIVEAHPAAPSCSAAPAGPGGGAQPGVVARRGRVLAFTDADCFPTSGWLRAGLAALDGAELVQGAVRPDPAAPAGPFDRTVWVVREAGLYECANLFCAGTCFDRIGGFEDWLGARVGKPLAEDAWLGWRARRAGARTAFCDSALVHHAVQPRCPAAFVPERLRLVYFPDRRQDPGAARPALLRTIFPLPAHGRLRRGRRRRRRGRRARSPIPLVASAP